MPKCKEGKEKFDGWEIVVEAGDAESTMGDSVATLAEARKVEVQVEVRVEIVCPECGHAAREGSEISSFDVATDPT